MAPPLLVVALAAALAPALGSPQSSASHPPRGAPRPAISDNRIPFGPKRKREMAGYARRHYGRHTWKLRHPRLIVLHFTDGSSWRSARSTFASNAPELGELPGTCAHFIVDKRGGIHAIVPIRIECRHVIGLNYTAIGVEMVQRARHGSHRADLAILHRRPQIRAALRLVAWLQGKRDIATRDVIGHAMANSNRYFKDEEGWRNDHTDWRWADVRTFRHRLHRL